MQVTVENRKAGLGVGARSGCLEWHTKQIEVFFCGYLEYMDEFQQRSSSPVQFWVLK